MVRLKVAGITVDAIATEFQFLMVRLKADVNKISVSVSGFQFLMVRLKVLSASLT